MSDDEDTIREDLLDDVDTPQTGEDDEGADMV